MLLMPLCVSMPRYLEAFSWKICNSISIHILGHGHILQRFSEVPDQLGMAILSVIPENPLLWAFLMQNFNLGIAKMSVIPENPLFPNPVLPKTSVLA